MEVHTHLQNMQGLPGRLIPLQMEASTNAKRAVIYYPTTRSDRGEKRNGADCAEWILRSMVGPVKTNWHGSEA